MTKSEVFKAAHKLARTFTGDYRACFALALREVRENRTTVEKRVNGFSNFLFRGNQPEYIAEKSVMVSVNTTVDMITPSNYWN